MITLHTTHGDIVLELDFAKAPKSSTNFLQYCKEGHYDGTIFHRVIPNFMIQGGGFEPGMKQKKTRAPIQNEGDNGLTNLNGTLAMARTNEPHSASSQFFINVTDNEFLNHSGKTAQRWGYAVFAKVTGSMDAMTKIKGVRTTSKGVHQDVPVEDVVINSVSVDESLIPA